MGKNYYEQFLKDNKLREKDEILITSEDSEYRDLEIIVSSIGFYCRELSKTDTDEVTKKLLRGNLTFEKVVPEDTIELDSSLVSEIEASENITLTKKEVIKLYEFVLDTSAEQILEEHDELKKIREEIPEINEEWKRLLNITNSLVKCQSKISLIERQVKRKDKLYEVIGRD